MEQDQGAAVTDLLDGLAYGGTKVTSTATELNLMDGGTSAGTTAVAAGDGIVTNDGGTMRQTTAATFSTYFNANLGRSTNCIKYVWYSTLDTEWCTVSLSKITVASGSQTLRVAITNLIAGQYVIIDKTF